MCTLLVAYCLYIVIFKFTGEKKAYIYSSISLCYTCICSRWKQGNSRAGSKNRMSWNTSTK